MKKLSIILFLFMSYFILSFPIRAQEVATPEESANNSIYWVESVEPDKCVEDIPLVKAIMQKKVDFTQIRSLIANGADINVTGICGETPLLAAAFRNHTNVIKLLLKKV